MDFKQYIKPAVGIAAFVIGGLIARNKAEDAVDTLRKGFESSGDAN